jgi:hypothetical protein
MIVLGHVLDPGGKPMAWAPVDIVGRSLAPRAAVGELPGPCLALGRGLTDGDGRFRIQAVRTSSERFLSVYVLAAPA